MKKITFVSIISILFFLFSSLIAYILRYIENDNKWFYFVIGIIIIFISALLAIFFNKYKNINITCLIMNSISLGFLIRAWYIFNDYDNSIWIMFLISLGASLLLWIYYLLIHISFFDRHPVLFTILFIIFILTIYVIIMCNTSTTYISTFGYYMIVEIAFIIATCVKCNKYSELLSSLLLSTYSIILVAIIMLLIMLAGDGIDGFDIGLDGFDGESGSSREKKTKKEFDKEIINDFKSINNC